MFREIVHSRLFMKTFMYYTIILIVPILIFSTVSYNYNIQKSKANAIRKCNEEAKNITSLIDGQLKSIQSLGGRIDMLSWVWKLAAETDIPDDGFTAIQRKDIINDLRIYMTDHVLLKDVILFFPKKDAAISLSGWFTIESFFNYLGKDEKILKLKEQLINQHNFDVLHKNGINIKNRSVLCLMHSIDKTVEPRAQAIFLIDENRIKQFIRSISPDNLNKFEIITSEGEAIVQVANGNDSNNKRVLSLTMPSNSFGWTYYMSFDTSFTQEQRNALLFLIITWLCSIIMGPVIAFLLARASYYPLKRLMSRIVPGINVRLWGKKKFNEYSILENAFMQLKDDNREMQKRVQEYSKYTQSDMLVRLLKGYFYTNDRKDLSYYGIDYSEEDSFIVLIINLEEDNTNMEERLRKIMMIGLLSEEKLKGKMFNYKIIDILEEDIVVILSDGKKKLDKAGVDKIIDELRDTFESIEDVEIQLWCGEIEQGILGISKSYQSAKEARNMGKLVQDIAQNADAVEKFYYPTDWEVQLINNLKLGKKEAVINIIDAIRTENEKRLLSPNTEYALYEALKNTIKRVLAELNLNLSRQEIKDFMNEYQKSMGLDNSISNKDWLYIYSVCHMICIRIAYWSEEKNDISGEILRFINENYTDASLSLKQIANEFGVSVSTVSKTFKKSMGINFYDYLCRLRMEKAKLLLNNSELAVKDICKRVGYENEFSFRRAFERYEGISISEYRNYKQNM